MKVTYDLIIIGSGPAGQKAALQGAKAGKKVAIVERYRDVGGSCVHQGTLPSKSFRESVYRFSLGSKGTIAQEIEQPQDARDISLPDMERLLRRKDRVVRGEVEVVKNQLKRNKVDRYVGEARFLSPHEIEIESDTARQKIEGQYIFICVGARPVAPKHIPIDGKRIVDSNSVLGLKSVPRRLVVLGAGVIGCEYASMFAMAGSHVYLVDKNSEILVTVDREIVSHLIARLSHHRLEVLPKAEAKLIQPKPEEVEVHLSTGQILKADVVLAALGRQGNTEMLGLDKVGVEVNERGVIKVNESFQTTVPHIYAMGDVIGFPALASTSMEQGRIASCHAFGLKGDTSVKMSPLYPYGIYTIPEISTIGASEEQLKKEGVDFVVGRGKYLELARGQIVGDRWGILKMIVDRKTEKLLGVHIVGDNAADLIHIGQAVMALEGDVHYFIETVFNYPTLAEAYKVAAFHAVNQLNGVPTSKS